MLKILIVEDDSTCSELLARTLSAYGNCDIAADGQVALLMYNKAKEENQPYQFICLDVLLPHVDGREVLRRIREAEAKEGIPAKDAVKIIITTSVDAPGEVMSAFQLGCEGYVVKPVKKEALLRELKKLSLI
ncbi:MAG: response regulator [Deltaproteobacteria bacterium]|nr:response regulator [Deltaproteobacteria bacterium]